MSDGFYSGNLISSLSLGDMGPSWCFSLCNKPPQSQGFPTRMTAELTVLRVVRFGQGAAGQPGDPVYVGRPSLSPKTEVRKEATGLFPQDLGNQHDLIFLTCHAHSKSTSTVGKKTLPGGKNITEQGLVSRAYKFTKNAFTV